MEGVELLNYLVNRPDVLGGLAPGYQHVDLTHFFDNPMNLMFGDERGAVIFGYRGGDVYEMHYLFTAECRGREALRRIKAAITTVFTEHGGRAICGAAPRENRAARTINRALGGRPLGASYDSQGRPCITYILEKESWAT